MKNNKKTLLGMMLAFVVLIAGASVLYNKLGGGTDAGLMGFGQNPATETDTGSADTEPPEGTESALMQAPDFTVFDADGNEVKLSDFFGKPVIVNFWASWCGPCKSEMPAFDELYEEYGDEINFLMVNMTDGSRETVEIAKEYIEKEGYSFPVYYDTEYNAAITYSVMTLPATYFIDADGNLTAQGKSALDKETIQTGIDMILPKTE